MLMQYELHSIGSYGQENMTRKRIHLGSETKIMYVPINKLFTKELQKKNQVDLSKIYVCVKT